MTGERRERRGAHIVTAVLDVIAERGLEAATLRTVAAAAGTSLAQVQYYFHSKDDLVAAAFQRVTERFEEKLAAVDVTGPAAHDVLRAAAELWLPLDDERARDTRIRLAFSAAAASSPTLREIAAAADHELRVALTRLLVAAAGGPAKPGPTEDAKSRSTEDGQGGATEGGATEGADGVDEAASEAALMLAVLDGLAIQALALPAADRPAFLLSALDSLLRRRLKH